MKSKKIMSVIISALFVSTSMAPQFVRAEQWQRVPMANAEQFNNGHFGGEGCQVQHNLAMDNVDGKFMIVSTDVGGLFRSLDGGKSWEPATIGYNAMGGNGIAVDPKNPNRVLVFGANGQGGTINWNGQHGIYLSTDKGATWINTTENNPAINSDTFGVKDIIAFDESSYDKDKGYCTRAYFSLHLVDKVNNSAAKLYKTEDGGETWAAIYGSESFHDSNLRVNPLNGDLFAANSKGLFKSTDKGASFTMVVEGKITGFDLVRKKGTDEVSIYASKRYEILKSADGGVTFDIVSSCGTNGIPEYKCPTKNESEFSHAVGLSDIKVSPVNPNNMVIGVGTSTWWWKRGYFSKDGGKTWNLFTRDETHSFMPINTPNFYFAWSPVNENLVYSSNVTGQIEVSHDGGNHWEWSNDGINNIMTGGKFNINLSNPNLLYIPSQDYSGTVTRDGGVTWSYANISDTEWGGFSYGGFAATPNLIVTADSTPNFGGWGGKRYLSVSRDGGKTFQYMLNDKGGNIAFNDGVGQIALGDPTDDNVLFAYNYRSEDQGYTWRPMRECSAVFTANFVGQKELYGAKGTKIVRSFDHGVTWETVINAAGNVMDMAYDHTNEQIFFIANDGLYKYSFKDKKIDNLTSQTPADQYGKKRWWTVAVDPQDTSVVYVGGAANLYNKDTSVIRSTDGGATWKNLRMNNREAIAGQTIIKEGLNGGAEASCIRVNPKTRYAYVGTICYGVWKIAPPGTDSKSDEVWPIKIYDGNQEIQVNWFGNGRTSLTEVAKIAMRYNQSPGTRDKLDYDINQDRQVNTDDIRIKIENLLKDSQKPLDSFQVYRSTSYSGPYEKVGSPTTGTTYVDKSASNGVKYFYKVQNLATGEWTYPEFGNGTGEGPKYVQIHNQAERIDLRCWETWNGSYSVFRSTNGGEFVRIATGLKAPAYQDLDVSSKNTYSYYMQEDTENKRHLTLNNVTPQRRALEVTWEAQSGTYNVYRRENSKGEFKKVASKLRNPIYTDHNVYQGRTYEYYITTTNSNDAESAPSEIELATPWKKVIPEPEPADDPAITADRSEFRLKCGAKLAITDVDGKSWLADRPYLLNQWGATGQYQNISTTSDIAGTSNDAIYSSAVTAAGNIDYKFSVPNGRYTVNLKFAEIDNAAIGDRIFNIKSGSSTLESNFDIVSAAEGNLKAIDKSYLIGVTDGVLKLSLQQIKGNPLLSGIEIITDATSKIYSNDFSTKPKVWSYGNNAGYSGGAVSTAWDENSKAIFDGVILADSYMYTVDVKKYSSQGTSALIFNYTNNNNYYFVTIGDDVKLMKRFNGQVYDIDSYGGPHDIVKSASTFNITYDKDGYISVDAVKDGEKTKLITRAYDTDLTSGKIGVISSWQSVTIDNVSIKWLSTEAAPQVKMEWDEIQQPPTKDFKLGEMLYQEDFNDKLAQGWQLTSGMSATNDKLFNGWVQGEKGINTEVDFSGNYRFSVDVDSAGSQYAHKTNIMFNYIDSKNYYYVNFDGSGNVRLKRKQDGLDTLLGDYRDAYSPGPARTVEITYEAEGFITVKVISGGITTILFNRVEDKKITHGGIGVSTEWCQNGFDNVRVDRLIEQLPDEPMSIGKTIYSADLSSVPADWSLSGDAEVKDGKIGIKVQGGSGAALYTGDSFENNYALYVDVAGWGGGPSNKEKVYFNYVDENNYYCLDIAGGDDGKVNLLRKVSGNETSIAPAFNYPTAWKTTSFEIIFDNGHNISVNATQGETKTTLFSKVKDENLVGGKIKLSTEYSSGSFTNISVKQLVPKDSTAPAEVTGLAAKSGDTKLTLRWTEPADLDFASVKIYDGSNLIASVDKGTTTKEITGLTNGTKYTYRLKTVDTNGNESSGVDISGTPAEPSEEPIYTQVVSQSYFGSSGSSATIPDGWSKTGRIDGTWGGNAAFGAYGNAGTLIYEPVTLGNNYKYTVDVLNSIGWNDSTEIKNDSASIIFNYKDANNYYYVKSGFTDTSTIQLIKRVDGKDIVIGAYENYNTDKTKFTVVCTAAGKITVTVTKAGNDIVVFDNISEEVTTFGGKIGVSGYATGERGASFKNIIVLEAN